MRIGHRHAARAGVSGGLFPLAEYEAAPHARVARCRLRRSKTLGEERRPIEGYTAKRFSSHRPFKEARNATEIDDWDLTRRRGDAEF